MRAVQLLSSSHRTEEFSLHLFLQSWNPGVGTRELEQKYKNKNIKSCNVGVRKF